MFNLLHKPVNRLLAFWHFQRDLHIHKMLTAECLLQQHKHRYAEFIGDIQKAELRVFSQWGDDGIIQFLINYLDIPQHNFIEFGVEDYKEANTRFLLVHDDWKGLVFDGSKRNIGRLKAEDIYWRHQLTAVHAWLTPENVNQKILEQGFQGEIGLLHIDVDGPDYHFWKAITAVDPVIVIVEYDHQLGDHEIFIPAPHQKKYTKGSSLAALCALAVQKGYSYIGSEKHHVNAYFVRNDKLKQLAPLRTY